MEVYNRSEENSTYASVLVRSYQFSGGILSTTSDRYFFRQRLTRSLSGFKNPSWQDQVALGIGATTPCSGFDFYRRFSPYNAGFLATRFIVTPNQTYKEDYEGVFALSLPTAPVSPPSDVVTNVTNRCIRKFTKRVKLAQNRMQFGETAGEIRKSISTLANPMSSMRKLISEHYAKLLKFKQRYRRQNTSLRKAASDSYLEFVFGWTPLADDVRKAYSHLQKVYTSVPETELVSASASELYSGIYSEQSATTSVPRNVTFVSNSHSIYTMRLKGAVGGIGQYHSVPQLSVLGLTTVQDFAVTAWNLLPYSFLVDYFVNVGNIIEGLFFNFSDLKWGNKTTLTKTRYNIIPKLNRSLPVSFPLSQWKTEEWLSGGVSTAFVKSFTRSKIAPLDLVPRLEFRLPTDIQPWVNISALIIGGHLPLVPFFKPR